MKISGEIKSLNCFIYSLHENYLKMNEHLKIIETTKEFNK